MLQRMVGDGIPVEGGMNLSFRIGGIDGMRAARVGVRYRCVLREKVRFGRQDGPRGDGQWK